jgi:PAS domain S-box-containing protein
MTSSLLLRYTVALAAVIACLGLRLALNPILGINVPFITFFFGVMVAAWYGGFGPGILAALLSTVVADHFFIAPVGSFSFNSANVLALSLFVVEAMGISLLSEGLHRAKQQAEAVALDIKRLLSSISDAFVSIDAKWRYTAVNERAAEILRRPAADLLGRDMWTLFPENRDTDWGREFHEAMRRQSPLSFEFYEARSGRWFENRLYPHEGGLSVFFSDITDRKQAEEQLKQWNIELERRVYDRTQNLSASRARLRTLAAQLSLAEQRERRRVATELHDYLAQMLALAKIKLAQMRRRLSLTPDKAHVVEELENIVTDSLDYTRTMIAELSPPVLYQFGLVAGIRWLAEQMRRHGLAVTVEEQHDIPPLAEDRLVFSFLSVRELLLNVIKHAGTTHAAVRFSLDPAQNIQIVIVDHGRGFDPATLVGSERFGLYSIRERIEAMGGRLDIMSIPEKGTTAMLTVPADQCGPELSAVPSPGREGIGSDGSLNEAAASSQPAEPALRVLLVDDHLLVRQGLSSILSGYENLTIVGEAADGEEAVERARRLRPDIVVMDVNMPHVNGIEATRTIRRELPGTTVVGLSVNTDPQVEAAMREAGAAAYLTKETAAEELHAVIHGALRASSAMTTKGAPR